MNYVAKSALIVLLVLPAAQLAVAQDKGVVPSPPARFEGKFAIADLGNDRTVVTLPHQRVSGENVCNVWVSGGYTFVGKPQGPPERVYISFTRVSTDEPKMLKSETERTLILSLDGETLNLGPMSSVKEVTAGYSLVTQGLMLHMPYETFKKFTHARKVGVTLGPLRFDLTEQNLQDFRDLLARMTR